MKTLVTYFSQTGNTKKVAEAIYEVLPEEKEIVPLSSIKNLEEYDFTFIGFPIHQSSPANKAKTFIKSKAKGKKIALFITHSSSSQNPMMNNILLTCKDCCNESKLYGIFNCQGVMSEVIANMLMKSDDPIYQQAGKMRELTLGHPNESELDKARNFAKKILAQI